MMKRSTKIWVAIAIIFSGIALFFILNKNYKKIKVLDCEVTYRIEKPKPGFIDYSKSDAENAVAICLCEKYMKTKDSAHKREILKLFKNHHGIGIIPDAIFKNPAHQIDSICEYRNMIFSNGIEL